MPMSRGRSSRRAERHAAVRRERPVELRDLISLGQIGIEVVLAREDRDVRCTVHSERERGADRQLDGVRVQHRQRARAARDRPDRCCAFGARAEVGGAAAEDLRRASRAARAPRGRRPSRSSVRRASSVRLRAERTARARTPTRNSVASSKCVAMICPPTGSPSTRPIGTDIAGTPARFAVTVKMSLRYISYGSRLRAERNAGVGVVGVKSTCTPTSKTLREVARDQRAHLLRLPVVRVVVAGREHVRAEQDAARDLGAEARRSASPRTCRAVRRPSSRRP